MTFVRTTIAATLVVGSALFASPASADSIAPTDGLWLLTVTQNGANALYGADGGYAVDFTDGSVPRIEVTDSPTGSWTLLNADPSTITFDGEVAQFGTACGVLVVGEGPRYVCVPAPAQLSMTVATADLMVGTATLLTDTITGTFQVRMERQSSLSATPSTPRYFTHAPWQKQGDRYRTTVSWAPPADEGLAGPVTGYDITVLRDGDELFGLHSENSAVILRKLTAGRIYVVQVRAVNEAGASESVEFVLPVPGTIPPDGGGGALSEDAPAGPVPEITSITPNVGHAGSIVMITGANFDDVTYVRFGKRLAGYYLDSPTTLMVTVPAGSGTVAVEVATSSGSTTIKKAFTYGRR